MKTKKSVKKRVIIIFSVIIGVGIILGGSLYLALCTPPWQKKKMREYYSDESNFVTFVGKITNVRIWKEGVATITIEQDELSTYGNNFTVANSGLQELLDNSFVLEASDKQYEFTTALAYWYDSFDYPILSIKECDSDTVYLSLETGKSSFISYLTD